MTRIWTHSPFEAQALAALPPATEVVTGAKPRSDAWFAMASGCDAMIIGGQTIIDGPALDRIGPRLRAVARTGIGYDAIDVPAATERGVMVINTPDGPTESTAEHAIALILNLAKGVAIADRVLRSGVGFPPYGALAPGLELRGPPAEPLRQRRAPRRAAARGGVAGAPLRPVGPRARRVR